MSYIVFDLDDTLLNNKKEVTEFTLSVLEHLRSLGHKIVINTARSRLYNQPYFLRIRPDYTILNGGAAILDNCGNYIYRREIPRATVKALTEELTSLGRTVSIQSDSFVYSNDKGFVRPDVVPFDPGNFAFDFDAPKLLVKLSAEEGEYFAKKYSLGVVSYFGGPIHRFNHNEATKALANSALVGMFGDTERDIIAFGDDLGDVEMLSGAGIGVIMKNAKPEIKDLFNHVTEFTNDEDGVARFLVKRFGL